MSIKKSEFSAPKNGVSLSLDGTLIHIDYSVMVKGKRERDRQTIPRFPGESAAKARTRGEDLIRELKGLAETKRKSGAGLIARTIEDVITFYQNKNAYKDLEPGSKKPYDQYTKRLRSFCASAGVTMLSAFDSDVAEDFQQYLGNLGLAPKSVNDTIAFAKMLFEVERIRPNSQIVRNPFLSIEKMRVTDRSVRWFSDEELAAIWSACYSPRYLHAFAIFYYSGMRTAELRWLETSRISMSKTGVPINISVEASTALRSDGKPQNSPKNFMRRNIPVVPEIIPHLEYFLKLNEGMKYLVGGDEPISGAAFLAALQHVKANVKKLYPGIDIDDCNIHTFRKTCGAHMLQEGAEIAFVSRYLGHSSIAITEKTYSALMTNNLMDAGLKLRKMDTLMDTLKPKHPQHYKVQ